MIDIRRFDSLGTFGTDWLKAHYHFSFAHYFDPARVNWGRLRVWNDDTIQPHTGFGAHGHRDMEIITYVRSGAISHRDSLGNSGRTEAGNVQVMSAGSGIQHEEMNHEDAITQIFQIWIEPAQTGGAPSWENVEFPTGDRSGALVALAAGRPGRTDVPHIRQDAEVLGAHLKAGTTVRHTLDAGRLAYLVPATGSVSVNGEPLSARDGAAIRDESVIEITALEDAEVILVDTI